METTQRPVAAAAPWAEAWLTVGVTGTNGKSSTTAMVAALLRAAGSSGSSGSSGSYNSGPVLAATTAGYWLGEAHLATPGDWDAFLALAQRAADAGCRAAAIEVTSQALAHGHARRWRFDHAVFTNLSEDHLGTHGSWEHYLASKAQLFVHLGPGRTAVLNAGDPASLLLDRVIPGDVLRRWYGAPSRGPLLHPPDLAAAAVAVSREGTAITLAPSADAARLGGLLRIAAIGEVFAENALAAASLGLALGLPGDTIVGALATAPALPGRFELLARAPTIILDYAHAADALARICGDARRLAGDARLIVVFGAGGGTDPGKRGPMGAAVAAVADLAIITSDNPRDEPPEAIAAGLIAGATGHRAAIQVELDRRRAIAAALAQAAPEDVVVIAGKGDERGQAIAGQLIPFADREVVRDLLGESGP